MTDAINNALEGIRFLRIAWRTYRDAKKTGKAMYSAVIMYGVPCVCVLVGTGREAWEISTLAIKKAAQ